MPASLTGNQVLVLCSDFRYTGTPGHDQKTTAAFAAKRGCIYRVPGYITKQQLTGTRVIESSEVFETPAINLKMLK